MSKAWMRALIVVFAVVTWTRPCGAGRDDTVAGNVLAHGGIVNAHYLGPTEGYSRKIAIQIEQLPLLSGIVSVGPIDYQFYGPAEGEGRSLVGAMLPTFGVEADGVLSTERRYTLRGVRFGPEPILNNLANLSGYGTRREAIVHAVVGAAIRLRWLRSDGRLADSGETDVNCDRMAALQLLIWESVFEARELPERWCVEDGTFTAALGQTPGVARELATLARQATTLLEGNIRVEGLRTITTKDSQDRLVIVRPPERVRVPDRVRRPGGWFEEVEPRVGNPVPGSPQSPPTPPPPPPPPPPPSVPLPRSVLSGIVGLLLVAIVVSRKPKL